MLLRDRFLPERFRLKRVNPAEPLPVKLLPAKPGNDVDFNLGKNVKLSDDGTTAIAEINGQVMLASGRRKISVEPVYLVNGDVNLKSGGNIIFLGSVMVKAVLKTASRSRLPEISRLWEMSASPNSMPKVML